MLIKIPFVKAYVILFTYTVTNELLENDVCTLKQQNLTKHHFYLLLCINSL